MAITITYELAMAAGMDAGNRSMIAGGRTTWNLTDRNVAAAESNRLLDLIPEYRRARRYFERKRRAGR